MSQSVGRSSSQKRAKKVRLFGGRKERPCCFCRKALTMSTATLEHVIPLSKGGGWSNENLRLSCDTCNHSRGDQNFEEFRAKVRGTKN